MLPSALCPARLIRHQRLYALAVLLALSACAPALFAAQHVVVPHGEKGGLPRGEKHEGRREIDQLEEKWRNAVLTGNITTMESLLSEDYISISASGTLQTKEETLARMRNPRRHITALEISDSKVRFYGTTALVTSFAEVTGVNAEGEAIGNFRYTHVYARNAQGQWKIVSSESSRIRPPAPRK
jgi:ketosteroid isomerase-like protein